jgi:thiosulfate/3-mercaptopyruvate sulfurtransferase
MKVLSEKSNETIMSRSLIIEVSELLEIFRNPDVLIFDVSNSNNAKKNYEAEHLEGALFVDLNSQLATIKSDASFGGRHPLPTLETFAKTLADLGISNDNHVIIYDDKNGSNASARFWWMLKAIGHEKVQVLNGGLNQAKKYGFPLHSGIEVVKKAAQPYQFDTWKLPTIGIDEVEQAAKDPQYLVVDVRDKDRYDGITEPIDFVAGHIPGAINIPFTENLDENGLFLNPEELKNKYKAKFGEIDSKNIIFHCGSGVTACHSLLALAYAGIEIPKLYVGSWSEWSRNNKPIATQTQNNA